MRFCQIRLPFAFLFCLLSCPIVSWADQTQPDQTASAQMMQTQSTTSQDMVAMSDDSVYYTEEQPVQMQPINHPIDQAYVAPVDSNVDQPADPGNPSPTAVTPEPSSMVLLTTGLLLGGLLWAQQRS